MVSGHPDYDNVKEIEYGIGILFSTRNLHGLTMYGEWYNGNVGALHVWAPAVQKNWGLKPLGLVARIGLL